MTLKKTLLFVLCATFFACNTESVDNPEEETTDSTLLKKIIFNKGTADEYTETYSYIDGNRLVSIDAGDDYKSVYTYEDDKLIREATYFDGKLAAYVTLEYNSDGALSKFIEYWLETTGLSERAYKQIFTNNADNTITREVYLGDHNSQTDLNYTEVISFNGKNISRLKDTDDTTEYIYAYDDKNGMFKNVYAIEILNLLSENEFGPYIYGNTNNIISNIESYNNQNSEEITEYTYNDNDYPKTAVLKFKYNGIIDESQTETAEYFYE